MIDGTYCTRLSVRMEERLYLYFTYSLYFILCTRLSVRIEERLRERILLGSYIAPNRRAFPRGEAALHEDVCELPEVKYKVK